MASENENAGLSESANFYQNTVTTEPTQRNSMAILPGVEESVIANQENESRMMNG